MVAHSGNVFNKLVTTGPDAIEYKDTLWVDLKIASGVFQFLGAADPTLSDWQPGGAGRTFKIYKFQLNDEILFTDQLLHNYKEGTDIKVHVHWTPGDRGVAESGKYVGWKLDLSWANEHAVFPSSTTYDLSSLCAGVDDQHEVDSSVVISGTGKTISSMLSGVLYRSDTGTDDDWVGTTAAQSPGLLEVDFHYQIDRPGSRSESAK